MADTEKFANVGTQKIFDINLIYSHVICLQVSNRAIEVDHLMSHEKAPLAVDLFADYGHMRIFTSKFTLETYMTIKVSSRAVNEEIEVTVIGGCALLWIPGWPAVANVQTYATQER